MRIQQFLDSLPIAGVFLAFVLDGLLVYECGYRIGRWWRRRTPEEREGPTPMIVGSLLALLAFLLAITMGMASDRFEARRGLVLAESNAVGTAYLRAGYLPEPASSQIRELLREYVPLRIVDYDLAHAEIHARMARSVELHSKLWSVAEELARAAPESHAVALFIESLNQTIDLHQSRVAGAIYGRVPQTVLLLLFLSSILTLAMVGYNAGLRLRRSPLAAVVMVILLGAVLILVVDLDRPREGFVTVNQQPLIDLSEQIKATRR
jgi:hypothetical protein